MRGVAAGHWTCRMDLVGDVTLHMAQGEPRAGTTCWACSLQGMLLLQSQSWML